MPRNPLLIIVPLLSALVVGIGVGGWFLLRPAELKRVPQPEPAPDARPPGTDPPAPKPPGAQRPKLVVLVVFDQMRGDYLARWSELYGPDGFERMKKDGVWFSDCQIPYACTSTGPGHASLATGAPPGVHGIIENEWYDRKTGARTYCCQPTRLYELVPPLPASPEPVKPERGSALGYSPERLLSPTVGDALRDATADAARVFSLSIKDRTAVLMGGKKPSGVYCFDTRDGRFHTGAYYREAAHPWVTEFNDAKLVDSWFGAEWTRLRPEAEYVKFCGPDDAPGEAAGFNGQGRVFPHALKGKLAAPGKKYYEAVEGSPFGNDLLLALAKKAVTAERLGRNETPDLLCVSFSSNDLIGHRWGPDSHEVMDVTLRSDRLVADFLKFLDAEVGAGRYAVVVTADHGVCPLPELPRTREQYPAARRVLIEGTATEPGLKKQLEAALDAMYGGGPTKWVEVFDADSWPWLYLDEKAIAARKLKVEDVAEAARQWFEGRGYIDAAFARKELDDKAAPDRPFRSAVLLAYRPDRCGDVIAVPKPGVLVTKYEGGTAHGSPQPYDTHVPFLAYGAGVPALGRRSERVSSLAVAPTLAWALGVAAPKDAAVLPPAALPVRK
jgi:hypothetical protein